MKTGFNFATFFKEKLKCDLIKIEQITGGRNSQIFKVEDSKGGKFAAKIYYINAADHRDRLDTEFNALNFLWSNNIKNIPEPIVAEPTNDFAIYEYIDGCSPLLLKISLQDIDQACEFLINLNKLRTNIDSEKISSASEAVFSINSLNEDLKHRYNRLMALTEKSERLLECQNFLSKNLYPFYKKLLIWSKDKLLAAGISIEKMLTKAERVLSPSDFGFHNAIRRPDGELIFLDFEYFGWDDPAKMISDFVLHPGMNLRPELKRRFIDKMLETFDIKGNLRVRLSALFPLFGIKWCFILLNEFIPADMARRDFSGNSSNNHEKRKIKQLNKAKKMLKEVATNYEQFYNFD